MSAFIQDKIAARLGGSEFGKKTEIYKFEKIKRAKAAAMAARPDVPIIDMGVGEPDRPADPMVVETLCAEAGKPENRFYADNGIPEFKQAAAAYLDRVYGVGGLDPDTQIVHGIGSKPILAMMPHAFIDPGDVIIQTTPGYPVAATITRYLGGEAYNLPLLRENGFLPDFDAVPDDIAQRAKLLYINYPNNPTGAIADRAFFDRVVAFARRAGVVVLHDAAYAALTFDGVEPLSFLSVDGAMDVGVEIHSMSKAFNMTGWRMAFIAGNPLVVKAFATIKDNNDSGQFRAIQKACITALTNTGITDQTRERYARRHALLVDALQAVGFPAEKPKATFYCYVPAPKSARGGSVTFASGEEASQYLITEASISTVPWDEAGAYLRFSVTFAAADEAEEQRVIAELQRRLSELDLAF
ncbi:MAG: LL-diaminopimelate aminotransferase [Planctomycetota bacterium]